MFTDEDSKTRTQKRQLYLAIQRSLVNLARAILVKVPDWSKLETEGEAAGINNHLQGVLLQKGRKKCRSWRALWCQGRKLFKIGYVTACLMIGMTQERGKTIQQRKEPTCRNNVLEQGEGMSAQGGQSLSREHGPLIKCSGWTTKWILKQIHVGREIWYWECRGILF